MSLPFHHVNRPGLLLFSALALPTAAPARAQQSGASGDSAVVETTTTPLPRWKSSVVREVPLMDEGRVPADLPSDRPRWKVNVIREVGFLNGTEATRASAARTTGLRLEVDVESHRIYAINGRDTLRAAAVATASGTTLTFAGKSWRFRTPRGVRTVQGKDRNPIWTPPEWHYAEVAKEYGLKMRHLVRGQTVRISDGTRLMTKGNEVGVIAPGDSQFVPLVVDEQIVFDSTLFIPPVGTKHRSIKGELGRFRLKLGNGYLLHGTPDKASVGLSVTHGCIRLLDDDIEWLYDNVPVGTKVYLY